MKLFSALFEGFLLILAILLLAMAAAFAQTPPTNTATITFSAPTARSDGVSIVGALSYRVYQGVGPGTTKTLVGTITTTTSTITTGLLGGVNYCWQVTATEAAPGANIESVRSNEACKSFPAGGLNPVTITVN